MADVLKTPYSTYHKKSYPAIDPFRPELSNKNKSAVVTGAGSGIGASVAISLAKSGVSSLALLGRRESALKKTQAAVEAIGSGTQVFTHAVDITDATTVVQVLDSFAKASSSGKIDILVANAGSLGSLTSIRSADPASWWSGFEVNIKGNFNLVHAFLPRASNDAAIIHLTSAVVHGPYFPNESSYCASKSGATKFFEYVHHENPDVFVLNVQPGLVPDTGMSAGFENIANGLDVDMSSLPWDDVALPAGFIVWAVSSEARFLSGRCVWANWDVDELKADRDVILANPEKFKFGLLGGFAEN